MSDAALVTLVTYRRRHEAEILRALLDASGIRAMVSADDEGGLNPGFFAEYGVRVLVAQHDLEAARELLAEDAP